MASSLSDLKEIGCKSAWTGAYFAVSWAIEQLLPCEIVKWGKQAFRHKAKARKICPRPAEFSLRFFKLDRLLAEFSIEGKTGWHDHRLSGDDFSCKGDLQGRESHTTAEIEVN